MEYVGLRKEKLCASANKMFNFVLSYPVFWKKGILVDFFINLNSSSPFSFGKKTKSNRFLWEQTQIIQIFKTKFLNNP